MEVLNPLARDYKSIGTLKKELAELQQELAQAHRQVCNLLVLRYMLVAKYLTTLCSSSYFPQQFNSYAPKVLSLSTVSSVFDV